MNSYSEQSKYYCKLLSEALEYLQSDELESDSWKTNLQSWDEVALLSYFDIFGNPFLFCWFSQWFLDLYH